MKKILLALTILMAINGTASAKYYLFEKEDVAKKFKENLPFPPKDFGEIWELGSFKDKSTALSFQNEFYVRFGFTPKVGHFRGDRDFAEYVREKQAETMIKLLKDLELLKRKIKTVRDPRFNSCYFINRINAIERCILREYNLKANFPRLVERIFYPKGVCTKIAPVNGMVTKGIIAEELKRIIDKYSEYQNLKEKLELILKDVYSTF